MDELMGGWMDGWVGIIIMNYLFFSETEYDWNINKFFISGSREINLNDCCEKQEMDYTLTIFKRICGGLGAMKSIFSTGKV